MHERCEYPQHKSYAYYGGRGIFVSSEWGEFPPFYEWSIRNGYEPGLKLDRRDNDGPYSPTNCRFVTHQQNMRNARLNVWIEAFGERKLLTDWESDERCRVARHTILRRIASGFTAEEAISRDSGIHRILDAFGERKSLADWCRDSRCKVPYSALLFRIDSGWTAEDALVSDSGRHSNGTISATYSAFGETKTIAEWVDDPRCSVGKSCLFMRIVKYGWSLEKAISTPSNRAFLKV